ncbi:phage holin family protein [Streptomyces sp. NA02950]|uniref:phage holin family protein n=1 Tax=Streptomyces sp. NA02950 TaxID=2742137 RepID=UPI0015918AC2|nr:phage holin family protein [Streptomyces sp. NA02950]QKV91876.1 phage holin family protein [Streptomyces sp. NA02950]
MTDKSAYPRAGDPGGVPPAGELSEPVARIVREEVRKELRVVRDELRDELREQSRSRTARLWCGAAAIAFYAGGVFSAFLVLLFALAMPGWAAALIVGALLMVLAAVLKNSAGRPPHAHRPAGSPQTPKDPAAPPPPTAPSAPPAPPTPPEPPAEPPGPPHRG